MSSGTTLWRYRRKFRIGDGKFVVVMRSRTDGLHSELLGPSGLLATDTTPIGGEEAIRNHSLAAQLPDGSALDVTAGYISALNVGIEVKLNGELVHASHPGRTVAYPEKYRAQALAMEGDTFSEAIGKGWQEGTKDNASAQGIDFGAFKRNRIPLAVDIALGLLFFVVAKLTDLTTAAIAGAIVGLVLYVVQRVTKIDLLGGLAMFGIVMMLISAGLAIAFDSDDAVKYRTTFMGLLTATLFLLDGVLGGKRLTSRLALYMPYNDIDVRRLGIGMGLMGVVMAGMNQAVAMLASTDVWLFYTTFLDFVVAMVLILYVFRWARGLMLRDAMPAYRAAEA